MSIRIIALKTLFTLCVALLAGHAAAAGSSKLRYSVDVDMSSTGLEADAIGHVQASEMHQGNADLQRLRITAGHLQAGQPYMLLAQFGTSPEWILVSNFTASASGKARLTYVRTARPNGALSARRALPNSIQAVTEVRAVAIATAEAYIVLSADLHASTTMKFEFTSVFENAGSDMLAVGCVAVACEGGGVQFRLMAAAQSSELKLCVNGDPIANYATGAGGRVSVGLLPATAPSPLFFRNLSLRNAEEQVVLQTDVH